MFGVLVSFLVHPSGVQWGCGQGFVQVPPVLPHQNLFLKILLCAQGHRHAKIKGNCKASEILTIQLCTLKTVATVSEEPHMGVMVWLCSAHSFIITVESL